MSAKALFTLESGDFWIPVNELIAQLPKDKRHAATLVWNAIVDYAPKDKAELRITDRMLQTSPWLEGYSLRFIQKGLQALSSPYEKRNKDGSFRTVNEDGIGLIYRERRRGLRTIFFIRKLKGGKKGTDRPQRKPEARTVPIPNDRKSPGASAAQIAAAAAAAKKATEPPTGDVTPEDAALVEEVFGKSVVQKAMESEPLPPTSGP